MTNVSGQRSGPGVDRGRHAIIVVDPQPDFFEDGPLPVAGATVTVFRIAEYLREHGDAYDVKIVTQDWHVDPGDHWSERPNFSSTWPVHCAADSPGAQIHHALDDVAWSAVIRKGAHEGAYSGFEGESADARKLSDVLTSRGVTHVTIVGFATDHCVRATALDARSHGFDVDVILDLCAGVTPETTEASLITMAEHGVTVTRSGYR